MNKKIILPLMVMTLGVVACNKNNSTINNEEAAKKTYEVLVNSFKDINNISFTSNVNVSKADFKLEHDVSGTTTGGQWDKWQNYDVSLNNSKGTFNTTIGGLTYYEEVKTTVLEEKTYSNPKLKVKVGVKDVSTNGQYKFTAIHNDPTKYPNFESTTKLDGNSLSSASFYLNHNVKLDENDDTMYYGGYFDLTSAYFTFKKLYENTTMNEAYEEYGKYKPTLKSKYKEWADEINNKRWDKVYYSLDELPFPVVGEELLEIALGNLSKTIKDYTSTTETEEKKAEAIKKIKEDFDKISSSKTSSETFKFEKGDTFKCTVDLSKDTLNKLTNKDTFTEGSLKLVIETDANSRLSKFDITSSSLKSNRLGIFKESEEKDAKKYVTLNGINGTINFAITYGLTDEQVNDAVKPTVTDTDWKHKSFFEEE